MLPHIIVTIVTIVKHKRTCGFLQVAKAEAPPLGKAIRAARTRAGLTQSALAELAGLGGGQSIIGKWERGDQTPNIESLQQLASALRVSVRELAGEQLDGTTERETARWTFAPEKVTDETYRRAVDSARRLTETLTDSWRKGQFKSHDELRATARDIAQAYPDIGRGYVEAWLDLFLSRAAS